MSIYDSRPTPINSAIESIIHNAIDDTNKRWHSLAEVDQLTIAKLYDMIDTLRDVIVSAMDEQCPWCFGHNGGHQKDCVARLAFVKLKEINNERRQREEAIRQARDQA
jgi:hypothetical protein